MLEELNNQWINLLIDTCILRNQRMLQSDIGIGTNLNLVDSILAGGTIIRAISLLDEGLDLFIEQEGISISHRYPKLFHRLQELNRLGKITNYEDIEFWRNRRNDVGHKVNENYTWEETEKCLDAVYRELNGIGLLSKFPHLKARKTVQRVEPTEPGIAIEQKITATIYERDDIYREYEWRKRVGKLSA